MGLRAWLKRETARIRDDWRNLATRTEEKFDVRVTHQMVYEGTVTALYNLAMVFLGGIFGVYIAGELILKAQCITPQLTYAVDKTCVNTIAGLLNPLLKWGVVAFIVLIFAAYLLDYWLVEDDGDA